MAQRNRFSVVSLALFIAIATPSALMTVFTAEPSRLLAQTSEPSPVPTPFAVPEGSVVRIDGSESLEVVNTELQQRYEASFAGTEVTLQTNGTPDAMQALRNGDIDIATIGRPLTNAEVEEGFQAIALPREKIAIIVGPDNPFNGNLTFEQFAQIFRGDITDWSEVGGEPGPIRLVDRADESDTRTAISQYEVWGRLGGFAPGATVDQLDEDSTDAVVEALGNDGLGYATYSKVRDRTDVTIIPMHQTLPDNPAYPYSQPRTLVHLGNLNPAAAAFVALASGEAVVAADPAAADTAGATTEDEAAVAAGDEAATIGDPVAAEGTDESAGGAEDGAAAVGDATAVDEDVATDGGAIADPGGTDAAAWLPWLALLLLPLLPFLLKLFRGSTPPPAAAPVVPGGGVSARAADVLGGRTPSSAIGTPPVAGASASGVPGAIGSAPAAGGGAAGAVAGVAGAGAAAGVAAAGAAASGAATLGAAALGRGDRPSSRIVLTPRNGSTGYAYWETPTDHRQALIDQGGHAMKLRIYDVTDVARPETADLATLDPQRLHQLDIRETDQDAHLILERDRDYLTEVGYETEDGHWLSLARSNAIRLDQATGLVAATNGSGTGVGAVALGVAGAAAGLAGAAALAGGGQPKSRIFLSPHNSSTGYAHWESPTVHRDELKREGGRDLKLQVYDVTGVADPETADLSGLAAERIHQTDVEESAQEAHIPLERDRDYLTEIGYQTEDGRWLALARSNPIRLSEAGGLAPDAAETGSLPLGTAAAVAGAALVGGGFAAMTKPEEDNTMDEQSTIEAAKYDVGQTDLTGEQLADVDDSLPGLPDGYDQSRILLMPRDPQWAYAYWDTPNEHKEVVRRQGGQTLALRLYDVTDITDLNQQRPHSLLEYECDELARDWYLRIPVSDRDYIAEIGYLTADGRWLMLARSNAIRIPPVYPSDWYEENFINVDWGTNLTGRTLYKLNDPGIAPTEASPLYSSIYDLSESAEAERVVGSLFGSMQQVPGSVFGSMQMTSGQALESMQMTSGQALESMQMTSGQAIETFSSYLTASGMGIIPGWGVPESRMIEEERSMSGIAMSGIGMSGIGFFSSMPPMRARKFWLVADAELIVYGATEPDATVFVNGNPIQLNPDGTFRFHMSFSDGLMDFPIMAIAADGEQTRAIHMKFNRETPYRRTNTKDEAENETY
jgi:ABC-type phosphate transport system substrate-binding protein